MRYVSQLFWVGRIPLLGGTMRIWQYLPYAPCGHSPGQLSPLYNTSTTFFGSPGPTATAVGSTDLDCHIRFSTRQTSDGAQCDSVRNANQAYLCILGNPPRLYLISPASASRFHLSKGPRCKSHCTALWNTCYIPLGSFSQLPRGIVGHCNIPSHVNRQGCDFCSA